MLTLGDVDWQLCWGREGRHGYLPLSSQLTSSWSMSNPPTSRYAALACARDCVCNQMPPERLAIVACCQPQPLVHSANTADSFGVFRWSNVDINRASRHGHPAAADRTNPARLRLMRYHARGTMRNMGVRIARLQLICRGFKWWHRIDDYASPSAVDRMNDNLFRFGSQLAF